MDDSEDSPTIPNPTVDDLIVAAQDAYFDVLSYVCTYSTFREIYNKLSIHVKKLLPFQDQKQLHTIYCP
jgi:hypothetical protein